MLRASISAAVMAFLIGSAVGAEIPSDERRPGSAFMSEATRTMQNDDTSNPGMLSVLEGERLWREPTGKNAKSCASCHGEASATMKGVAARYPAIHDSSGRPIDLAARINLCREDHQAAPPLAHESDHLLALTAYVGNQSRGMPITPPEDARLDPFRERGRALFEKRMGQLELACASCHDDNWSKRLGGSPITQAHPTGYPIYRLEWQSLGSLQRRVRNCMVGVRAKPYDAGAEEFVALEMYLKARAAGMQVETPAVRP